MSRILTLLCLALGMAAGAAEPAFLAKVVGVHDGDTTTVYDGVRPQIKVRLAEIDAPELKQPHGAASKGVLSKLVFQREVQILPSGQDRYQRMIAQVRIGQRSINGEMVQAGAAWRYDAYSKSEAMAAAQAEARRAARGLWALPAPVPPWKWRPAQ